MKLTSPAADDHPVDAVIRLISALRGEGGCPWDKKQTPATMARYLLEEAYELADAIESHGPGAACEELGDVLFHILFITFLYQETGDFDLGDVSRVITEKMTRRHPHVFGGCAVSSAEEVKANWRKIKQAEKETSGGGSALDSVPKNMPALLRTFQILKRASSPTTEKDALADAIQSADAEWKTLKADISAPSGPAGGSAEDAVERRFGRLLLDLIRCSIAAGIYPETALRRAVGDFEMRFREKEENHDTIHKIDQSAT